MSAIPDATAENTRRDSWRPYLPELVALAAILLLALALRAYQLGHKSLWLDELVYARSAYGQGALLGPFGMATISHPPGYLLLLRLVMRLGRQDWLLRLPAMLASVGGVVALWALGRSLLGSGQSPSRLSVLVGLLAAFLLAISRFHVQYAQEVHSYALFATLSTLLLWALHRAARIQVAGPPAGVRDANTRPWLGAWWPFILAAILNLYIHYYALIPVALTLFLFPCFLLAVTQGPVSDLWRAPAHRRAWRNFLLALVTVALLYLPQIAFGLSASLQTAGERALAVDTGRLSGQFLIGSELLTDTLLAFVTGRSPWQLDPLYFWTAVILFVIGLGWLLWRRPPLGVAALIWLIPSPIIVAWFAYRASFTFAPRRLIFLLPIFLLVVAAGMAACGRWAGRLAARIQPSLLEGQNRTRWVTLGVIGLFILAFGKGGLDPLGEYYRTPKQDWKTLAAILETMPGPNDAVVLLPSTESNIWWYYQGAGQVIDENLPAEIEALCRASQAVYVAAASTGTNTPEESAAWLAQNFIQIPLQMLRLYYRNCQPGVWYGQGAEPLFEMATHPGMSLPLTRAAFQAYRELAAQHRPEPAPPDLALAAQTPAADSPASIESPAPTSTPSPTPTATPTATPTPLLDPVHDLGAVLALQADQEPDNAAAQVRLAVYLAGNDNLNQAADHFQAAIALEPDSRLVYFLWASALDEAGRREEALAVAEQGLAALPDDTALSRLAARLRGEPTGAGAAEDGLQATLEAGRTALRAGAWQTALASAQTALAQSPQAYETHLLLGDAYRALGRPQDALAAYEQASALSPHFGFLYARQGEVLARLDRLDEALEAGLNAVALDQAQWESWNALGRAYTGLAIDDPRLAPLAESALQRAAALAPVTSPAPFIALADFYSAQKRPDDAVRVYQELVATQPGNREIQRSLADLLLTVGRPDESLAVYRSLADADPTARDDRMALAAALAAQGRIDEALAEYESVSTDWPDFPWAYVRRGELLETRDDLAGAIAAYEGAVQVAPDNASAHFILAYAYRRNDQREQAIAELEAGLALDPGRESARQTLEELRTED